MGSDDDKPETPGAKRARIARARTTEVICVPLPEPVESIEPNIALEETIHVGPAVSPFIIDDVHADSDENDPLETIISRTDTKDLMPMRDDDRLKVTVELDDAASMVEFFQALARLLKDKKRVIITVE